MPISIANFDTCLDFFDHELKRKGKTYLARRLATMINIMNYAWIFDEEMRIDIIDAKFPIYLVKV